MARIDGRDGVQLRPATITTGFLPYAEGSVLIQMGSTRAVCTASIEESVPPFRRGQGIGWLTAEYRMLPRATLTRTPREGATGILSGRTQEIQRIIGRSLRTAVDFAQLGERSVIVDCDIIQADGGTRTAAITGGYVAVALALRALRDRGVLPNVPLNHAVAAVSVGIVGGEPLLDLCYDEDRRADVDCNVVMTDAGELVEFQATAEGGTFSRPLMDRMLDLARQGIEVLLHLQVEALEKPS